MGDADYEAIELLAEAIDKMTKQFNYKFDKLDEKMDDVKSSVDELRQELIGVKAVAKTAFEVATVRRLKKVADSE